MSYGSAPKYGKIELLLKSDNGNSQVLKFEDCGLMITGDYIVVILDEKDDVGHTLTSSGEIFHMSTIKAYKTYKS